MKSKQTGLTLVELMVSVAIGLFMIAMVSGLYVAVKGAFKTDDAMVRLNEDSMTAFQLIGDAVRVAGFAGCASVPGTLQGNTQNGVAGNWFRDTSFPVTGLRAAGGVPDGAIAGTDVLRLIGVDSMREVNVAVHDADAGVIVTGPHDFRTGESLFATDCEMNTSFVMTSAGGAGATRIEHQASGNVPGNCNIAIGTVCPDAPEPHTLKPGASVMPLVANQFYVAASRTPAKGRSLWTCTTEGVTGANADCHELINGVENMHLYFAIDDDGNGVADRYLAAGEVADWSRVIAVQVKLALATMADAGARAVGGNAYQFDGESVTPAAGDLRIFRESVHVFAIRNRGA